MTQRYVFGSQHDLAREQVQILSTLWDGYTERAFDTVGVAPGARCLDLGAGAGTATRMLAERAGPTGDVLAVDLDASHYADSPHARLVVHDITTGLPEAGPFDVIHARLLLMHLPDREEILARLAEALAPGGWLVIADNGALPRLISAPTTQDAEMFERFQSLALANATRLEVSFDWAERIGTCMEINGLGEIHGVHVTNSAPGGSLEAMLSHNYVRQMEESLLQAGIDPDDVQRYREIWLEPSVRFWFYGFACWAGRRPVG
ncbi:MAG TPA: class I SAM-dependent methyltransferase [Candidatus Ruania gallistercoris]|uniref:Class I SAM-dependent methyltransferase n=1 Tax=Candidatus Ruania gallistercoris TaxID=2838746 RepID=A0A9D2J3G4_9MICO|nr:class I SAM-dependent methyltransferase [Candidatus Ruania gallistercoris]